MDNQQIGQYLQIAGIVVGALTAVVLVQRHPILIGCLGLGAVMYFVGQYLRK